MGGIKVVDYQWGTTQSFRCPTRRTHLLLPFQTILTFDALSKGSVGIHGSTGVLHGRSLRRMRALIDRTLAEVRMESGTQRTERVSVAGLIEEIEIVAGLEANERGIKLSVEPGPHDTMVEGDHQIIASVVANLVQNAFKFTRVHSHITVRAHSTDDRVLIDVKDQCGGLPAGQAAELFRPSNRHLPPWRRQTMRCWHPGVSWSSTTSR